MADQAQHALRQPLGTSEAVNVPVPGYVDGQPMPVSSDRYFEGEPGLVATFDFDYDKIIDFQQSLQWAQFMFIPPAWISCLCCYPCFLNQNVEWKARAQHVALTVDGIRFVTEKRQSWCGLACSDVGRDSKTVPYDKITDCDVQEPAGAACCCCIPRVLSVVKVDTASSGGNKDGVPQHELCLEGLKFSTEFKQAVWSMKRGHAPANATVPMNGVATAPQQVDMMSQQVLVDIREELRQLNTLLRSRT